MSAGNGHHDDDRRAATRALIPLAPDVRRVPPRGARVNGGDTMLHPYTYVCLGCLRWVGAVALWTTTDGPFCPGCGREPAVIELRWLGWLRRRVGGLVAVLVRVLAR